MRKLTTATCLGIGVWWMTVSAIAAIKPCDELKNEIAAKIIANGALLYRLEIVNSTAVQSSDDIVGTCDGGNKRIIYSKGAVKPQSGQELASFPASIALVSIPPGAAVNDQLNIEQQNYRQLRDWKRHAELAADRAVSNNDANLYRAAVKFRDKLLPFFFQYFSASNVAEELLKHGYKAREAPTPPGKTAQIVACQKANYECQAVDPRVALFMAPVTLLPRGQPPPSQLPRPEPPRPLIRLPLFPGIEVPLPSPGPFGHFPVGPGQLPVPVPVPIPIPIPLPHIFGIPTPSSTPLGLPGNQPEIDLPGVGKQRVCVPWC